VELKNEESRPFYLSFEAETVKVNLFSAKQSINFEKCVIEDFHNLTGKLFN